MVLVGRNASVFRSRALGGISGVRANGVYHSYYGTLDKTQFDHFEYVRTYCFLGSVHN